MEKSAPPGSIPGGNQHCAVLKHRDLIADAPERLHEEISNDYREMIHAVTRQEIEARRNPARRY
jgi:hypothetical protein